MIVAIVATDETPTVHLLFSFIWTFSRVEEIATTRETPSYNAGRCFVT